MRRMLSIVGVMTFAAVANSHLIIHGGAAGVSNSITRHEHPRLFINSDSWNEITAVLGRGGAWKTNFQNWITWLDAKYLTTIGKDKEYFAMNFAFAGLMAGSHPNHPTPVSGIAFAHAGREYTERAKQLFAALKIESPSRPGYPIHVPVVYDWIWHSLSPSERGVYSAWLANQSLTGTAVDAWADAGDVVARAGAVMAGLAIFGDGHNDAWADSAVNMYRPWFRGTSSGVTTVNSLYGGSDGGFSQGWFYGYGYHSWLLPVVEEAVRTATGVSRESHYGTAETNVLRYMTKWLNDAIVTAFPRTLDAKQPDGYQWRTYNSEMIFYTPGGSTLGQSAPPTQAWLQASSNAGLFAGVDSNMASLAKWYLKHRVTPESQYYQRDWVWGVPLLGRWSASVVEKSPSDLHLPLSKQRGDGTWIFRSSWDSIADSPVVMLLAPRWVPGDYGYRHSGAFHVYRKGPQIHRGYSTDGHHNKFGIGGSIMTFVNWGESLVPANGLYHSQAEYSKLGAERTVRNAADYRNIVGTSVEGARVIQQWTSDGTSARDVDYVSLDLTRLYSSVTYPDVGGPHITDYVRQLAYFRPSDPTTDPVRLIVYDRPTAVDPYNWATRSGKNGKTWLLWTAGEPTFANGTVSDGPSRGPTGTHGKWYSDNATLITATNTANGSDGKVWLTPVLPSNRRIIKVGGPNSAGQRWNYSGTDPSTWSHEFETPSGYVVKAGTYGVDPRQAIKYPEFTPPYHIEIEDRGASPTEVFVNVVEVTDSGASQSATTGIVGSGFIGARVGDRIAVFAARVDQTQSGSFVVPASGTFRILVTGLVPDGAYIVATGGSSESVTSSSSGTLYLTRSVSAGTTVSLSTSATPTVRSVPPAPTLPPLQLRAAPSNLRGPQ